MPLPIAAMLAAAPSVIGALGSLFGKGKGEEIKYSPMNPQANQMQNQLMQYLMSRMGQQNPFAQVNPMSMNAMNMVSSYYTGNPYTQPGWGQGSPGGPNPFANQRMQLGGGGQMPQMGGQPGMGGPGRMQPGMGGGRVNQQALQRRA